MWYESELGNTEGKRVESGEKKRVVTPLPSDHKHAFLEWHHVSNFVQGRSAEITAGKDGAQILWGVGWGGGWGGGSYQVAMPRWPLCMVLSSARETYRTQDIHLLTGIG